MTIKKTQTELLPCPFCGGKAKLFPGRHSGYIVKCIKCPSEIGAIKTPIELIYLWNTRVSDAVKLKLKNHTISENNNGHYMLMHKDGEGLEISSHELELFLETYLIENF